MKVCCIKTADAEACGIVGSGAFALPFESLFSGIPLYWIERNQAETDTTYKQLIPYSIIANAQGCFACYPRHGNETRLHGLYSCGIGGHIDEIDKAATLRQTVYNGMYRELSEEFTNFRFDSVSLHYKGIIHESETKVGLVHIGIVFFVQCAADYLPEAAEELAGLQWKSRAELRALKKERWSDLAFRLF